VRGSSSSAKKTAVSPAMTTGRPPVSTTTTWEPGVWPGAGTSRSPGRLQLAVYGDVLDAGRLDPLADRVVVLAARVVELAALDVVRPAGEEMVAAAVVEVQVRVDDDVDAGQVEVGLRAQWSQAWVHVGHRRVQRRHAGVDEHARVGMVDDVHVDRHPVARGEQLGHKNRGDGRRRDLVSRPLTLSGLWVTHRGQPVRLRCTRRGRRDRSS